MNKTLTLAACFAVVTSTTFLSACGTGEASVTESPSAAAEAPVPVEVARPSRGEILATYTVSASIASDRDAPVTARVTGEVVELIVEEGEHVKKGQPLARLDGKRLRLEMLAAKANLERASKEFERNTDLHARGLISASVYDGLKYDLEALEATYRLARLNHDYATIRATISGVVSSRDVKQGQNLTVGQVVFRITDTSELMAYLEIPQTQLPKFSAGTDALVSVAAMPGELFPATIARISPTIDMESGTFRATAIIDNAAGNIAPGMFGRFDVAYEKHTNAMLIPAIAMIDEDDQKTVYVVADGTVVRRVITTGIEHNGVVEVLDGLDLEEKIVVVGHGSLRNGSKVLASASSDTGRITG